jgi:thiaminase
MYYSELAKTHTDEEINEIFREYMNSLNAIGRNPEPAAAEENTKGKEIANIERSKPGGFILCPPR